MSFAIIALKDDFTNSVRDPVWGDSFVTGSATLSETGGQAVCQLPSSTAGAHLAAYTTSAAYDLTSDAFYWNIGTMVATGVAASAYFQMLQNAGAEQLYWQQLSNAIMCRYIVGGVDTLLFTATWSASTYKYIRIRESAGTIFWDSSTNGTSWTNRASVANPFAVTALTVQFAASCGNVASPGSLRLDDVNLILPAPSSTWRETTADWGISNRLRPVTLGSDGFMLGAIVTADTMDSSRVLGGTLHYYAGPLGSSSGGFLQLTEYASLALAQASPFPIPINGRVDLPALVDARYMRLYHRSTDASARNLYEFVPRRIVQADDIEAESIRAINIAAGAVTADKIFVLQLSAITADVGILTAGIIEGVTIYAGGAGRPVKLDATGLSITENTSGSLVPNAVTWYESATPVAFVVATKSSTVHTLNLLGGDSSTTRTGRVDMLALGKTGFADTTRDAELELQGSSSAGVVSSATLSAHLLQLTGVDGISLTGNVAVGGSVNAATRLRVQGASATSSDYSLIVVNSAGTASLIIRDDNRLSFYGVTEVARQTVAGSRGANAALASLCTALAAVGIIIDGTTI